MASLYYYFRQFFKFYTDKYKNIIKLKANIYYQNNYKTMCDQKDVYANLILGQVLIEN